VIRLLLVLAVVACHPGTPPVDAIAGFARLARRACACPDHDVACVNAADRAWLDYAIQIGKVDYSDDELTQSIRIGVKFEECLKAADPDH
jgi:hypothetical protein